MGMDSPLQWEPVSVNGNGEIRYLTGGRRGPDLRLRPAAEDVKAFGTNPEWFRRHHFHFSSPFNWLIFPAAAEMSGMEGGRANEDSATFDIRPTSAKKRRKRTQSSFSPPRRRCCCSDPRRPLLGRHGSSSWISPTIRCKSGS